MTRPVTRRRFAAHVAGSAVAAVAALLLTACSADPADSARSPGASSVPVTPARLGHALPDDPVRMVLPVTGAETRWTQGLDVFGQQVTRVAAASCARSSGIGLPEQVPLAFIRYFELPDLDFIARHGLSADAAIPTPVTLAVSATARSGSPAAVRRCQEEGAAAAAALRDAYIPLQRQWFRQLAALRGDPATVKALRALPDCLAGHGVQAPDEQGFMAVADAREQTATAAELPYTEGELGRTYALCMRPVEAVREPARRRLRTRFLTDHADEIRDLRETFLPALHRAEQRYGVPLVFPAP